MPKEKTTEGISTTELCAESKKYLSRLLIGRTGIKPDFLTWDLLLTEKLNLDFFVETGEENLEQLIKARDEWNQLLKENKLKPVIENKLIFLECRNKQEEDFQFKRQQESFRVKKRGLIAISLLITLIMGYFYILPLSTAATFVGMLCLGVGATLICCYIVPAFTGESGIDPEWHKKYSIEKEKYQQIITKKIKGILPTEIAIVQTQQTIIRPLTIQNKSIELNQTDASTAEKLSASNNGNSSKKSENTRFSFFPKEKLTDTSKNTIPVQMIIHTSNII